MFSHVLFSSVRSSWKQYSHYRRELPVALPGGQGRLTIPAMYVVCHQTKTMKGIQHFVFHIIIHKVDRLHSRKGSKLQGESCPNHCNKVTILLTDQWTAVSQISLYWVSVR